MTILSYPEAAVTDYFHPPDAEGTRVHSLPMLGDSNRFIDQEGPEGEHYYFLVSKQKNMLTRCFSHKPLHRLSTRPFPRVPLPLF